MKSGRYQNILLITLGIVFVVLVVIAGGLWERRQERIAANKAAESEQLNGVAGASDHSLEYYAERQQSAIVQIDGPVTAVGNSCDTGAVCSLTVGGKTVTYGPGITTDPQTGAKDQDVYVGQVESIGVGTVVHIKARSYAGGTYTVMNCGECSLVVDAP